MSDSLPNPSQQVERIREILVGRQVHHLEGRLRSLEADLAAHGHHPDGQALQRVENTQAGVLQETHDLRLQLQNESRLRSDQVAELTERLNAATRKLEEASAQVLRQDRQVEDHVSRQLENISGAMAARIDARVREILQHLQAEMVQWKHQLDRDLHSIRESKVDHQELRSRLARLAAAAMEDDPPPAPPHEDQGFLL